MHKMEFAPKKSEIFLSDIMLNCVWLKTKYSIALKQNPSNEKSVFVSHAAHAV